MNASFNVQLIKEIQDWLIVEVGFNEVKLVILVKFCMKYENGTWNWWMAYLYRSSKSEMCPAGIFPVIGDTSNTDSACAVLSSNLMCLGVKLSSFTNNSGIYKFISDLLDSIHRFFEIRKPQKNTVLNTFCHVCEYEHLCALKNISTSKRGISSPHMYWHSFSLQ